MWWKLIRLLRGKKTIELESIAEKPAAIEKDRLFKSKNETTNDGNQFHIIIPWKPMNSLLFVYHFSSVEK